jgi:hypothetical protein
MKGDRPVKGIPALSIVFSLFGCSSFERDWKAAAAIPSPPGLAGRWEGSWRSTASGHSGELRCLMTAVGGDHYQARYRARWGCCFKFEYTVPLQVEAKGQLFRFQGTADLGWLAGGLYRYDGEAGAARLLSTYSSRRDHGEFEMARPAGSS